MIFAQFLKEKLRGIPWALLVTVYALVGVGLFSLYSASGADVSPGRFNDQVNWVLLGSLGLIFWGLFLDMRSIERLTFFGYLIAALSADCLPTHRIAPARVRLEHSKKITE